VFVFVFVFVFGLGLGLGLEGAGCFRGADRARRKKNRRLESRRSHTLLAPGGRAPHPRTPGRQAPVSRDLLSLPP
jgi:hypothetical protein